MIPRKPDLWDIIDNVYRDIYPLHREELLERKIRALGYGKNLTELLLDEERVLTVQGRYAQAKDCLKHGDKDGHRHFLREAVLILHSFRTNFDEGWKGSWKPILQKVLDFKGYEE